MGEIFGPSSILSVHHALLDSVRNTIATDELILSWCLLAEESSPQSPAPGGQLSMLSRKQHIYKLTRRLLADNGKVPMRVLLALGMSSVIERLFGNVNAAAVHRKALVALILRDGIPVSDGDAPQRLMVINILIGIGIPELYHQSRNFSQKIENWQTKLRQLQKHCAIVKTRHHRSAQTLWRLMSKGTRTEQSSPTGMTASLDSDSEEDSEISHRFPPPTIWPDEKTQRWYLAGLFTISKLPCYCLS
jgi:competence protein ComGC